MMRDESLPDNRYERLRAITETLATAANELDFSAPAAYVYNPLIYAREPYLRYLKRYGGAAREAVMIGMNPGPWGMAQTGVPFGAVPLVRDWLGIEAPVGKPSREHPKRPVTGFGCVRTEVSGLRLWGWVKDRFGNPENFFRRFFVINYCPLLFLTEDGVNVTPDKLCSREQTQLATVCRTALRQMVECYEPRWVIGIGAYTESQARLALQGLPVTILRILHPSPASPLANRGWGAAVEAQLHAAGITVP